MSVNVDVNDDGRCGRRYRDKGLEMCCGGESYWTGSGAVVFVEQRKRVRDVIDNVSGGGEVRLSVSVDINNDGRCGCRFGEEGPDMCCGGKSYRTGSEAAAAAAEQRAIVRVVVDSVCVGKEVNRAQTLMSTTTAMWSSIRRQRSRDVLWRRELPDWF